jgi:ribose-phosphate pyrophosphokinase
MPTEIIGQNSGHMFFPQGEEPYRDEGRLVIAHSPDIPYDASAALWVRKNIRMKEAVDCSNYQIVMLNLSTQDLTSKLYQQYQRSSSGLYVPAHIWDQRHEDGETEFYVEDEAPSAEHVYLVGPLGNPLDYLRALTIADHYKERLNAKAVTLIATYLGSSRSDKNVDSNEAYVPKGITIETMMELLAVNIDRIIALETHSSLAQYYSEMSEVPFLPISPWNYLIAKMGLETGFASMSNNGQLLIDPEKVIVAGPDKGRNWAAKRIAERFDLSYVSGNKKRINDGEVIIEFSPEDTERIKGKETAAVYDDEIASGGTGKILGNSLKNLGIKNIYMAGVHAKLVGSWKENIMDPSITSLYLTDSRKPLGKIGGKVKDKIHVITIAPLIADLIDADIEGVDFWHDPRYSSMILQQK